MMRRCSRRVFLGGAVACPLLLAACGGGQPAAAAPPEISYGRDTCDRCGMIISDERYAGGLVAAEGTNLLFDDVGEMLQSVAEDGLGGRRAWAHDWNSGAWIDAATASYVRADPAMTPMGTGFAAFAARQDAESFAAEHDGAVMTWDDAIAGS
jgi:copper chaperone NosL